MGHDEDYILCDYPMAKAQQILMQLAINNGADIVWLEDGATLASKIELARNVWKAAVGRGKV